MRFQVIIDTGVDSAYSPDREHVASFVHKQHAAEFADSLSANAYVIDCFDDFIIHRNKR